MQGGVAPCPSESAVFWLCQKSYSVTFDKSNKTEYTESRKVVAIMGRISMPQGKGSQMHNRRDYEKIGHEIPDNIDQTKTKNNVVLVDMDIKEAYKDIFGEAVERYNDKQKRDDRKIADYYSKIENSKNGEKLFYEDVLQWGKKEDFEGNEQLREKAKDALTKYAEDFQERNPNLRVIGAYIHMDEASPHLHLDYVPVAHGYKRGMDTRNSLDKALEEQGIDVKERKRTVKDKETGEEQEVDLKEGRYNNRTMAWKEREREYFGEICQELGLEVEAERNLNRKQLTVAEYKEIIEPITAEANRQREYVEAMKEGGAYTNEQGEREYIGYTESIKHMENTKERLKDNVEAYENGGFFYDWEKKEGHSIPDGGIEQTIKDAEAKAEQITKGAETEAERITGEATDKAEDILKNANDQADKLLDRLEDYETDQKAQIDEKVKIYEQEQKEGIQDELEGLRGQLDNTRDAIQKNNGIIQGQVDRYGENEKALTEQSDKLKITENMLSQKQKQLDTLDKELTAKAASVERISQSFDRIAERVPERDAPEPVIKAHKVIDQEKGFMREEVSHKEYSVSIPASSLEDAKELQREIGDLYTKHYTKETFKDLSDASERQAKEQADRMIAEAQERIRQADNVLHQQQQILQQANQQALRIKEKAERERTSILEKAKLQAQSIVEKAQNTLESLKNKIMELTGKRDKLQDEVDHTIEQAQIKADAIIQEAHEQAGTDRLYEAINERLGIVPMRDVADARQKVLDATERLSDVLDDKELAMIKANDAEGVYESLKTKVTKFDDMRPWGLRSAILDYQKALDAPHNPQKVLEDIQHTMNRSISIGITR